MEKKLQSIALLFAAIIIASVTIYLLLPKTNPRLALEGMKSRDYIEGQYNALLDSLNLNLDQHRVDISLMPDNDLLKQIQSEFGIEQSSEIIKGGAPAYYWRIKFITDQSTGKEESGNERQLTEAGSDTEMRFNLNGKLLEMNLILSDTTFVTSITENEARIIAEQFIRNFTEYSDVIPNREFHDINDNNKELNISLSSEKGLQIESTNAVEKNRRTDYSFSYSTIDSLTNNKVSINITVKGNKIAGLKIREDIPKEYTESSFYPNLIQIILIVGLIILLLIVGFKKIRAYEIGFKVAGLIGIFAALSVFVEIYIETIDVFNLELLIGWILGPLFLGFAVILLWSVSEAVGREAWKEKYTEFDLFIKGHLLHSKIGFGILNGMSIGLILLAIYTVIIFVWDSLFSVYIMPSNQADELYHELISPLYHFSKTFYGVVFIFTLILAFTGAVLKKRIVKNSVLILILSLVWIFATQGDIRPFGFGVSSEFLLALAIVYVFIKYNLLVSLVALFTLSFIKNGICYLFLDGVGNELAAPILIVLFLLPIVYSMVLIFSSDKEVDLSSITPAFEKHITERQRLQGEIEIARTVQISFLPTKNPEMEKLDIASKCLPAYEVGGDYYDFVFHDKEKLGVVIGDVSGKGTRAAFYMTLTKGFLKALTRSLTSPAQILIQMNDMFYDNVVRGNFISMIYGIFDLRDNILRVARAGHNPILIQKSSSPHFEFNRPGGIALGLEKGSAFTNSIEEIEIPFEKGDIFVFYTDGFTEAVNNKLEEFGEHRLGEVVTGNRIQDSQIIMDEIFLATKNFIGRQEQRDDMTIVVIKIR